MSALTPESWPVISALLDEALALPAAERDTWLQSLDGERAALKDTLRELLSRADSVETKDFLATLPRLTRVASPAAGPLTELAAGESIGPYRLISELGTGGMGAVWLAERSDGVLKRKVALKLPRLVWARGLAERMARERDILASLEHPQIARLYDAGVDQHGRPYLALEYVEGQPIDVYAKERGLSVRQKLDLLLQVAGAVTFAHSRLVVHRDLKPSNILVTADGQVRLLDFGIAKLMEGDSAQETQLTRLAGRALTLDYASPEQIKGEPIGTASDVYSLGVVAYELLTGSKPYKLKRGSAAELEEAIANADAPLASDTAETAQAKKALRGDLDAILTKALRKPSMVRYATVSEFAADIRRHLDGRPVGARPDTAWYRASRWVMRHRIESLVAAGVVLMVVGGAYAQLAVGLALALGLLAAAWQARRNRRLADEAIEQAGRADAIQRFVLDLFRANSLQQPDPQRAQQTTSRELLELGATRLLDDGARLPLTARVRLLDAIFELLTTMHAYEVGAKVGRERVAAHERTSGAQAEATLNARVDLLQMLTHRPEEQDALIAQLTGMLTILQASGRAQSPVAGRAHSALGNALIDRDFKAALAHLQSAEQILGQADPEGEAFAYAGYALTAALIRVERYAEAVEVGLRVTQAMRRLNVPWSLVQALRETGEAAMMLGDLAQAERLQRESVAVGEKVLGRTHATTISAMGRFAMTLREAARWDEAESTIADACARCVEAFGPDERFYLPALLCEKARTATLRGQVAAAERDLRDALARVVDGRAGTYGNGMVLQLLARSLWPQGRVEEAAAAIEQAREIFTACGFDDAALPCQNSALIETEIALERGDAEAARRALARIGADDASTPGGLRLKAQRRAILASALALLDGDLVRARQLAEQALAALASAPLAAVNPAVTAQAQEALARALLAAGDVVAARAAVGDAVVLRERHERSDSVWLARSIELRDRCQRTAVA